MTENQYQAKLIRKIRKMFPGCEILKSDSAYKQGIPDLVILYQDKWGTLEVKRSEDAPVQPNQVHYVAVLGSMSFSAFIYPENEEEVLFALQQAFEPRRRARVSQS